jgi:hypothetical protein
VVLAVQVVAEAVLVQVVERLELPTLVVAEVAVLMQVVEIHRAQVAQVVQASLLFVTLTHTPLQHQPQVHPQSQ